MNLSTTKQSIVTEKDAVVEIFKELLCLIRKHPRKAVLFIVLELWVHSLGFHHIEEMKDLMDLIPFFNHIH